MQVSERISPGGVIIWWCGISASRLLPTCVAVTIKYPCQHFHHPCWLGYYWWEVVCDCGVVFVFGTVSSGWTSFEQLAGLSQLWWAALPLLLLVN